MTMNSSNSIQIFEFPSCTQELDTSELLTIPADDSMLSEGSIFKWPDGYVRFMFNGTRYIKLVRELPLGWRMRLESYTDEIFLSGIPAQYSIESVIRIASMVGEVYWMRFKFPQSCSARGFAFLQFVNAEFRLTAITRLRELFREHSMFTVHVRESRNPRKLLIKHTTCLGPRGVYDTLQNCVNFQRVNLLEISHLSYEYQVVFLNSATAEAGRAILESLLLYFGPEASIVWDYGMRTISFSEIAPPVAWKPLIIYSVACPFITYIPVKPMKPLSPRSYPC